MPDVEYQFSDGISRIHLNRPQRLNAVIPSLTEGLLAALTSARDDQAGAVVLAGRGRAFCAGHDLKEPETEEDDTAARARLERLQDVTRAIRDLPAIVIAAVHGYALGAGCEFALGCDLVVAAEDARFGFPEVGVGLSVTGGISAVLPRVVGPAKAKELLLLGEHFSAAQGASLGLVNRVVPADRLESEALSLAAACLDRPPIARSLAKSVMDLGLESSVDAALEREVEHALVTRTSGEAASGRARFDERRA